MCSDAAAMPELPWKWARRLSQDLVVPRVLRSQLLMETLGQRSAGPFKQGRGMSFHPLSCPEALRSYGLCVLPIQTCRRRASAKSISSGAYFGSFHTTALGTAAPRAMNT